MNKYLADIYRRKDFIIYLVSSGLKAQHRNTLLGYGWWLLDPFLNVLIYYLVVAVIFKRGGEGYGFYLVIGMVVWRWLNSSIATASKSIVSQAGIITQTYLPKAIFPVCTTITQLINFGFGLVVIIMFSLLFRITPGIELLWLPYTVAVQLLFTTAIALFIGYVCVFIRDIETLVGHLLRIWFFASPVIWQEDMFPGRWQWIIQINPMTHLLSSYRDIFMYHSTPDYQALLYIGVLSGAAIVAIINFYSVHEHRIIKAL